MADVQVNAGGGQPVQPAVVETRSGGGASAVWAILVIVLLAIVAWFIFGRGTVGRGKDTNINANVKVETPAPAPSKAP